MIRLAKLILAISLLAYLAWSLDPGRLLAMGLQVEGWRWGVVALLGGAGWLVQWRKWALLLQHSGHSIAAGQAWWSLLGGFALGLMSPGRLGELGRGVFLPGDQRVYIGLTAVDRLSSFGATMLLGAWGAYRIGGGPGAFWLLGLGACLIVSIVWRWGHGWGRMRRWRAGLPRLKADLLGRVFLWSLVFNLLFCTQFYILLSTWVVLEPQDLGAIPLIYALKGLVPLSFLDLGVREGMAAWVLLGLGLDPAAGFQASLGVFAVNVLLPGIVGLGVAGQRLYRGPVSLPH